MTELRAYFDTSELLKRYVNEEGSFRARLFTRRFRCVTADITSIELSSALARRLSLGQLDDRAHHAIWSRVTKDRATWVRVRMDDSVLVQAEQVASSHHLKTLDAIHVGSALDFQARSATRIPFISADVRQLNAAASSGLRIERVL